MFALVSVFSKKAIKPIIESMEKQKQFITDAGHEIKTPLAIISANADVLELTGGDSEWITSIRNQITRLDKLVKNLLTLSKIDEGNIKMVFTDFDLSKAVFETAGAFEAIAETQKKKFQMELQPGLKYHGDESSIQQLISTLVDNALKYSNVEGSIKISLNATKKGAKLEVFNTADEIDKANLDKLFGRFYRADSSRSRDTGGYGIGLSIAKSIVEAHHGKISVKSDDGKSICFTVII
jgi:signal transduction histidine kinase